jgi:Ran GTPase-activating protein (RanGAP) involved in mRNA processing and transport
MTIEEILYVLQRNRASMLCGRALGCIGTNGVGNINDAEMALLAKALRANTSLTVLDLSKNTLSAQGTTILLEALRVRPKLKSLNLSFAELGSEASTCLTEALSAYTSLTAINFLGNCGAGECCPDYLIKIVKANASLRLLRLTSYGELPHGGLAKILQHLPQLAVLDLSRCDLNDSAVIAISEHMKKSKTLRTINLAFSLAKVGAQKNTLLDALMCNHALHSIRLNAVHDGGFDDQRLADVLSVNTALTSLDFYGNRLSATGVVSIAAALAHNTSLTSVGLGRTHIRSQGAQALAEALAVNTTLTSIDLRSNAVLPQGAQAIAAALYDNTSLVSINVSKNQIGDSGTQAFADVLLVNTTLTSLNIHQIRSDRLWLQASLDTLRVNTSLRSISMSHYPRPDFEGFNSAVERDLHKMRYKALRSNPSLINIIDRQQSSSSKQYLVTKFGSRIHSVLVRNQRHLFFIQSPHALKNLILYSLFSKPLRTDLLQEIQLPHIIKFQLTQCAIELTLLDQDILARAIMAGWCCGCGSFEDVAAISLGKPDYACSLGLTS